MNQPPDIHESTSRERKMSGNCPSDFRRTLLRHFEQGMRPRLPVDGVIIPWKPPALHQALETLMRGHAPDIRTVRTWMNRDKEDVPQDRFKEPLLTILFGDDEALKSEREEITQLWDMARQEARPTRLRTASAAEEFSEPATNRWVTTQNNAGRGLAALQIQMPASGRNDPDSFWLQVTLSFAQRRDEIEGVCVLIGLKQAELVPAWTRCQPAELLPVEHVQEAGGVFQVIGPLAGPNGLLSGRPLENTHIAKMERTAKGLAQVRLSLRSGKRDLDITQDDPNHSLTPTREAILRAFLQRCQVEGDTGLVTWGEATLDEQSAL